jgi:hypothetical protein
VSRLRIVMGLSGALLLLLHQTVEAEHEDLHIHEVMAGADTPFSRSLPCDPAARSANSCGSREFSTPQLFNLPHLGPFFHDGSARTL